jgi:hypothetical protein
LPKTRSIVILSPYTSCWKASAPVFYSAGRDRTAEAEHRTVLHGLTSSVTWTRACPSCPLRTSESMDEPRWVTDALAPRHTCSAARIALFPEPFCPWMKFTFGHSLTCGVVGRVARVVSRRRSTGNGPAYREVAVIHEVFHVNTVDASGIGWHGPVVLHECRIKLVVVLTKIIPLLQQP